MHTIDSRFPNSSLQPARHFPEPATRPAQGGFARGAASERLASFVWARVAQAEDHVEFEDRVHDLVSSLVASVPAADGAIEGVLSKLGEFLLVDRIQVFRGSDECELTRSHRWQATDDLFADERCHVATPQAHNVLASGECFSDEIDAAGLDGTVLSYSRVAVPVALDGRLVMVLAFDSVAMAPNWVAPALSALQYLARVLHLVLENQGNTDINQSNQGQAGAGGDVLTSLPNWGQVLLLAADRDPTEDVLLLLLDLDDLGAVNHKFGHEGGDLVLAETVNRLKNMLRPGEILSRVGGDEFVVLSESSRDPHELVEQVMGVFQEGIVVAGTPIVIEASVGVARGTVAGLCQALAEAEAALVEAKRDGGARLAWHTNVSAEKPSGDPALLYQLGSAVQGDQLRLYLQPKVDLRTGALTGAEGLVRWQHPSRGLLSPNAFLTVAERSRCACAVDRWMIREALSQLRRFGSHGWSLSVNLVARDLRDPEQYFKLLELISGHQDGWPRLELELTERAMLGDLALVAARLSGIKRLFPGVRVAIDDFGQGFSSISYLRELPVDTLKLDRSLVAELGRSRRSRAIVRSLVQLAHELDQVVVAEGIEDAETAEIALELGCDQGQGYHFSYPLPVPEFDLLLAEGPVQRSA